MVGLISLYSLFSSVLDFDPACGRGSWSYGWKWRCC